MGDTGITVDQLKAELVAVRRAVLDILTAGQSVSRTGLAYTRANLKDLQDHEKYLTRSITRSQTGLIAVGEVRGSTNAYPEDSTRWDG